MTSDGRTNGTEQALAAWSVGFASADGGADDAVSSGFSRDNNTTALSRTFTDQTSRVASIHTSSGGFSLHARHNAFITDGFQYRTFNNNDDLEQRCKVIIFYDNDGDTLCEIVHLTASAVDATEVTVTVARQPDLIFVNTVDNEHVGVEGEKNAHSLGVASFVGSTITQGCTSLYDEDGEGTSNSRSAAANNRIAHHFNTTGTNIDAAYEVTTMSATQVGITTQIDTGTPEAIIFDIFCINFGGEVEFDVGALTLPTSTGNNGHTGVGFTPQVVVMGMHFGTSHIVEGGTSVAGISQYVGMADGTEEHCIGINVEDDEATTDTGSMADDSMVSTNDEGGAAEHTGTLTSFDSDGWTVNYSAAPVAYVGWWLAIEDPDAGAPTTTIRDVIGMGIVPFARS